MVSRARKAEATATFFLFFFKLQKNVADRQAISNTWHPVTSSGKGRGRRVFTISFVLLQGAWRKDVNSGEPLATANRKTLRFCSMWVRNNQSDLGINPSGWSGLVSVVLQLQLSKISISVPK